MLRVGLIALVLAGCSGWQKQVISGTAFDHMIAYRTDTTDTTGPLHIYIHGDGKPFIQSTRAAADPSPRRPYVLSLMAADPTPSVLLGRPCYFRARAALNCHPKWWTTHRYAQLVVDSLAASTNQLANGRDVVLIGYSGGGSLAMLMAPKVHRLKGVVTVAANLDIDQWTTLHGYTPLHGSLNPAYESHKLSAVPQVHYVGADDEVVPASLARGYAGAFPPRSVQFIPAQEHDCCWHKQWPELLKQALQVF